MLNSGFKRYSFNFNGSYNITPKLKVSSSVMYILSDLDQPFEDIYSLFQRVQGMAPTTRVVYANPDGSDSDRPFPGTYFGFGNAQYYADKRESSDFDQRVSGSVELDYKITPKLTAVLRGSHRVVSTDSESFTKAYENGVGKFETTRISSYGRSRNTINQLTALLRYRNTFAQKHSVTGLLGWEYYHAHGFSASASTRYSPTDLIPTMNAGAEASGNPTSFKTEYAIASVLGQFNYDYDMRYLVGLTFRYDGTTRLMQDKWGFFPGISLGWNVHNEQFYKNSSLKKYINSLKPRISYGVNGNIDALGNYIVQGSYGAAGTYNSEKGYVNTRLLNPTLRWERSTTLNFGLDAGFLGNRITLMADYFIRDVVDKITGQTLPIWTGFGSIDTNNGVLQNRGLELQVNANLIRTKDFDWNVGFNLTSIRSYAKKLPFNKVPKNRQGGVEIYDEASGKNIYVGGLQEGERLGYDLIVGYLHDGVYKTEAELEAHKDRTVNFAFNPKKRFLGDTRWVDRNGDNVIDSKDMAVLGRSMPDFTGGINTSLRYKDFGLYIKGDFAVGHKLYNGRRIKGIAQTQGNQNGPVEILNSWSPDNAQSNMARYDFTDQQKNHLAGGGDQGGMAGSSSYFLEKGDYFALREITLSYDLKKPLFGGFVKGARFYATGANLHYFTGFSGTTPEVAAGGNDTGRYPLAKTFTLGLNLTF